MEMLNSFSLLLANDLWTTIIGGLAKWIVNYGWTIILFTVILKLVLTPLDIGQRVASQKQSRVMALMQPEMAVLQAKYGNDKEKLNQEQAKLYKKYNVNVGGMCFTLALTMILTLVITFTLYGSLKGFGEEKLYSNYKELDATYVQAQLDTTLSEDEIVNIVIEKYEEQSKQNSWLWVKNVWKSDTTTSQFVDFEDYAKHYKITGAEKEQAEDRYEIITKAINNKTGESNGYYILIILAVLVSFLTQFLSAKLMAPKGQKLNMTNKIMMAIVPITMVILVTTSNVVYTLYVIINSLMSAIISTIISLIMKKKNKGDENPEQILKKMRKIEVVEYSRNYKK